MTASWPRIPTTHGTGSTRTPRQPDYFGDLSVADMGMRVDTDDCSRPTNTFLHLIHGDIGFTPGNTGVAEDMTCGAGETLSFEDTNFLMVNKDSNGAAVTTYFVSKYNMDDTQGTFLRIPSAALGIALYAALPLLVYTGHTRDCAISVAAVNLLVLWQLWR